MVTLHISYLTYRKNPIYILILGLSTFSAFEYKLCFTFVLDFDYVSSRSPDVKLIAIQKNIQYSRLTYVLTP